jgi:hypothetical protein
LKTQDLWAGFLAGWPKPQQDPNLWKAADDPIWVEAFSSWKQEPWAGNLGLAPFVRSPDSKSQSQCLDILGITVCLKMVYPSKWPVQYEYLWFTNGLRFNNCDLLI